MTDDDSLTQLLYLFITYILLFIRNIYVTKSVLHTLIDQVDEQQLRKYYTGEQLSEKEVNQYRNRCNC